jgi:hypothetical protein
MIWVALLIPAYFFWRESVFFVIAASIYANVKSDWAASEAADDRKVMDRLEQLEIKMDGMLERLEDQVGGENDASTNL